MLDSVDVLMTDGKRDIVGDGDGIGVKMFAAISL